MRGGRIRTKTRACLLIVDDSRETVAGLSCYFSRRFDVLGAFDGNEGLRLLEDPRKPIDLVIADLILPGISGMQLISMVKSRFPSLPVIAMTGWYSCPDQLAARTEADCILFKPFELELLEEQVVRLLGRPDQQRETVVQRVRTQNRRA